MFIGIKMYRIVSNYLFLSLGLLLFAANPIFAQQGKSSSPVNYECSGICEILLINGKSYIGTIKEVQQELIIVVIEDGLSLEIPKDQIKSIKAIPKSRIKGTSYWAEMPVENSYFFGSSARNQKKGDMVFRNSYIFLNGLDYGVTDWLSIGIGAEVISTFSPATPPIGYLRAKIGIPVNGKINLGANLFHLGVPGYGAISLTTLSYTYGVAENHLTLGFGFALSEDDGGGVFTLSYLKRIGIRTAFVTENYFLAQDVGFNLFSYGVRMFGERLSVDFGFVSNAEIAEDIVIGVPYLGFQLKL